VKHPFETLRAEYTQLLGLMKVRPEKAEALDRTVQRLLGNLSHYSPVTEAIGVPEVFIATSFEREASSDFTKNPAQGWPLTSVSKWEPHNGPFRTWKDAAIAAYKLNGLDKVGAGNWTWELICFYGELFNGFGYRDAHHMHSPYLWGWTNIQTPGKYVKDSVFDGSVMDQQMGIIPAARRMAQLMPALATGSLYLTDAIPAPKPSGLAAGAPSDGGTVWVQHTLNLLGASPLLDEDGSYGRQTLRQVEAFQRSYGLAVDGLAGPETTAALRAALAAMAAEATGSKA